MFTKFLKRNNDPIYTQILTDKYIFSQTFSRYVKRVCIRNTDLSFKDFKDFAENEKRLVYKPLCGGLGCGVQVFESADYPDLYSLYEAIIDLPSGVLEQWIPQHSTMSEAYPHAVNCIRVATLYRDGKCNFLGALLTLGCNKQRITNAFQGALFSLIDMDTGIVASDLCNYSDEVYHKHPDTGFVAKGFQVPFWKEILELTANAAAVIPQVGYIGWDVAITSDGPVLIEGNGVSAGYLGYQHWLLRDDKNGSRTLWEPFVN